MADISRKKIEYRFHVDDQRLVSGDEHSPLLASLSVSCAEISEISEIAEIAEIPEYRRRQQRVSHESTSSTHSAAVTCQIRSQHAMTLAYLSYSRCLPQASCRYPWSMNIVVRIGPIKITQRTTGISGISVYGRSKVCFGFGVEVFISILYGQPKMRRSRNTDWGCRVTWTPSHIPDAIGCSNK